MSSKTRESFESMDMMKDFGVLQNNMSIKFEAILRFDSRDNNKLQLLFFRITGYFKMNVNNIIDIRVPITEEQN